MLNFHIHLLATIHKYIQLIKMYTDLIQLLVLLEASIFSSYLNGLNPVVKHLSLLFTNINSTVYFPN